MEDMYKPVKHSGLVMPRRALSQDPLMFSGSLRFNLDFQGHHSDEEIWAALRLARLDRLVMDMPLKLDEPVEETLGCC
jgi:ABC-type multidrug transport system fused ATPase/permease subunit